jgi:O-antigen/teichoic acid export membrane protein
MKGTQFVAQALAQVSSRGVMLAAGFVQFLYLSRSLGPAGYGLYSVAFSLSQLVFLVLEPATASGLVPMLAGHPRGREFARTCGRITLGLGLLLTLTLSVFAPAIAWLLQTPELVGPLRCLAPAVFLQLLSNQSVLCLHGDGRWYATASSFSLMWLTRLVASWALVEQGWGVLGAAAAIPLSFLIQFGANQLQGAFWVWQPGAMRLRDWWSHSRHLMAGTLLHNMVFGAELPLLKRFVSVTDAGQYAAAQNLGLPVQAACVSVLPLIQQRLAKTWTEGQPGQFRSLCQMGIRLWICLGVGVGALSPLAPDLGRLMFGSRYEYSGQIARILLIDLGIRLFLSFNINTLAAQQRRESVSRVYLRSTLPVVVFQVLVLAVGSRYWTGANTSPILVCCAGACMVRSLVLAWLSFEQVRSESSLTFPWGTLGRALVAGGLAAGLATCLPGAGWFVLGQVVVLVGSYLGLLLLLGETRETNAWTQPAASTDGEVPNLAAREPGSCQTLHHD